MLLGRVKAQWNAKHRGSGHTAEGFQATIRQDLNLSVFNRRPNAARSEYGVWPFIGQRAPGSRSLGPGRGRPITGNLNFWWTREGRQFATRRGRVSTVYHPGQKPDPIMGRTLQDSKPEILANIRREIARELATS
jgi:hypothetical protein